MAKQNQTLGYVLLAGAIGVGLYAAYQGTRGAGNATLNQVPGGATINTQWGAWQNNTGQPVWVNATGMIVNAAGDLLGNIAQIISAVNQGNSGGGGAPQPGAALETGIGNIWNSGYYYNPLPVGLM